MEYQTYLLSYSNKEAELLDAQNYFEELRKMYDASDVEKQSEMQPELKAAIDRMEAAQWEVDDLKAQYPEHEATRETGIARLDQAEQTFDNLREQYDLAGSDERQHLEPLLKQSMNELEAAQKVTDLFEVSEERHGEIGEKFYNAVRIVEPAKDAYEQMSETYEAVNEINEIGGHDLIDNLKGAGTALMMLMHIGGTQLDTQHDQSHSHLEPEHTIPQEVGSAHQDHTLDKAIDFLGKTRRSPKEELEEGLEKMGRDNEPQQHLDDFQNNVETGCLTMSSSEAIENASRTLYHNVTGQEYAGASADLQTSVSDKFEEAYGASWRNAYETMYREYAQEVNKEQDQTLEQDPAHQHGL